MHTWTLLLHGAEVVLGVVWLWTSFVGHDPKKYARQLARAGVDPRTGGPSIWVQRVLGALLIIFGILGFAGRP